MGTIRARGEVSFPTDTINLTITFYDGYGNPANGVSFPQISIVQPDGLIMLPFTSAGVSQINVGTYLYSFEVPFSPSLGVYNDVWKINTTSGNIDLQTRSFIVDTTQLPMLSTNDGYQNLGDDVGFNYSQIEIRSINKMLKTLKARFANDALTPKSDAYGNTYYANCSIFSNEVLIDFLALALTEFNAIPYFTSYTFADVEIMNIFHFVLVEGAMLFGLATQSLISRGSEFVVNDNGVSFTPPLVSEMLNTEFSNQFATHYERLKYIKNSIRPRPISTTVFSMNSSANPQITRLKHLRERRLI